MEEFDRLFETIGLSVWQHGGGRSTTLADVTTVARQEKLDKLLPVFREGAEKGPLALLTAFFFRRAGRDETFELTHKTFGEYLAARRLARLIEDLHRLLPAGTNDAGEGLRHWYRLTYASRVTPEILAFLGGELAEVTLDEVLAQRSTLIELFDENLHIGMPNEVMDDAEKPNNYRRVQQFTAAAELALLAAVNQLTISIISKSEHINEGDRAILARWVPKWENQPSGLRTGLWDLLRRLQHGASDEALVLSCLNGICFDNQAARTRLAGARLQFASARNADLCRGNLEGVDLRGADLEGAKLVGTNFDHPSREPIYWNEGYASFPGFASKNSVFIGIKLREASAYGAIFCEPDFSGADLVEAKLQGAILAGAIFKDADLTGADLQRANLHAADFSGSNVSGANFGGADLSNANFLYTKGLTRRQLKGARNVNPDKVPPDLPES